MSKSFLFSTLVILITFLLPITAASCQPAFKSWIEDRNGLQITTYRPGDSFYIVVSPTKAPYRVTIIWNYPAGSVPPSTTLIQDTVNDVAVRKFGPFHIPPQVPTGTHSIVITLTDLSSGLSSKKTIWFSIVPTTTTITPSDNFMLYASVAIIIAVGVPLAVYVIMRSRKPPEPVGEYRPPSQPPTSPPVKPPQPPAKKPRKPVVKGERRVEEER